MIEGLRAVRQIIDNKTIEIKELFFDESQEVWVQDYWAEITERLNASVIDKANFEEVSDTDNPQGVLALCVMPQEIETNTLASKKGIILATDGVQDPGNMGTIIRTAAWFGVSGLLVGKGSVDIFHPKVTRSTAGATGTIPHQFVTLQKMLPVFEQAGWRTFLLEATGDSKNIKDMFQTEKTIIVVGNEANGINPELRKPRRKSLHIESKADKKQVESLNAAIALSIALYQYC